MPIVRVGDKVVFFAHVPKCAGSSIEDYLALRFGPLALLDRKFSPGSSRTWTRNSPQHISVEHLECLFPVSFFDAGFAFVRDPATRFLSAFYFHQLKRKTIDPITTPEDFLLEMLDFDEEKHGLYDKHFRTQTIFVPRWCQVFKLEDGFAALYNWIDDLTCVADDNSIGRALQGTYENVELSDYALKLIASYYDEDYKMFGYTRPHEG